MLTVLVRHYGSQVTHEPNYGFRGTTRRKLSASRKTAPIASQKAALIQFRVCTASSAATPKNRAKITKASHLIGFIAASFQNKLQLRHLSSAGVWRPTTSLRELFLSPDVKT